LRRTPFLAAALFIGCDRSPARVVVGRNDTLVVNTQSRFSLPAAAFTSSGRPLNDRVSFAVQSGTVLEALDDSTFRCDSIGDASVVATAGTATTTAFVRCHPIRSVRIGHDVSLAMGGDPLPILVAATGIDGKPVSELGIRATIRDSGIAVIRDGKVYPKSPGRTIIDLDIGCQSWIQVTVYPTVASSEAMRPDQMFVAPLRLVPGAHAFWRVPVGHYDVVIRVRDSVSMKPAFSTVGTTCFPHEIFSSGFGCASVTPASFVVRNDAKTGSGRDIAGTVSIARVDSSALPPSGIYASREISRRLCAERPFG
jgi:hypothetical protein